MAYTPPAASDELPDSQVYGYKVDHGNVPADGGGENGFYDTRDDLVGGTDTPWSPNWVSFGDNAPSHDARADYGGKDVRG